MHVSTTSLPLPSQQGDIKILTILTYVILLIWESFSVIRGAYWAPFDALSRSPQSLYHSKSVCRSLTAGADGEQQESWGQFVEIGR